MRLKALVYQDHGSTIASVNAICDQLQILLGPQIPVKKVDSVYLRTKQWQKHTILLAFGGGRCRDWDKDLQKEDLEKIKHYVADGGTYLGFCAGAYFASRKTHFACKDSIPIKKERCLSLFSGTAKGPLEEVVDPFSLEAASAEAVEFQGENGFLYYQSGCYFTWKKSDSPIEVIARYQKNQKPCAIHCKVGQGSAILFGPHPEFFWTKELTQVANARFNKLAKILSQQEEFRASIWHKIRAILQVPPVS